MQIDGPSQVHGPHALQGPHFTNRAHGSQAGSAASGPTDQLDISPAAEAAAEAAAQASEAGQVRSDLVARVRSEIASGTYETPDKLDAALDRLLDHLG